MSQISKTADKALAALQALGAGDPLTPAQLSLRIGENRTVSQRLLTTLLERGFVARDHGAYTLSAKVRSLADAVQPTLRNAVSPHVSSLSKETGETVVFQIRDGGQAVVLEQHFQNESVALQVRHDIGSRSPLEQTANGLAILSALSAAQAKTLLSGLSSGSSVAAALDEVRATGFARTSEGLQVGVSGMAVAVHRDGQVVGSVAILVPSFREDSLENYQAQLLRAAKLIEETLNS
jgi:DNA-binding IclR family transcriptional regulator